MEMFKLNLKDKIALTGTIILVFGVGLLAFTFVSAYAFLAQDLSILTSSDIAQTFGDALAPLISTCIRIMYLGVMGWVGSLLTIRGVTILSQARQMPVVATQEPAVKKEKVKEEAKAEAKAVPKVEKTEKPEAETKQPEPKKTEPKTEPQAEPKPYEPEVIMLPPKTMPQTQKEQQQEKPAQADQK
jgi:hypothetical protein